MQPGFVLLPLASPAPVCALLACSLLAPIVFPYEAVFLPGRCGSFGGEGRLVGAAGVDLSGWLVASAGPEATRRFDEAFSLRNFELLERKAAPVNMTWVVKRTCERCQCSSNGIVNGV